MKYQLMKTLYILIDFDDEEFDFLDRCIRGSEYARLAKAGPGSWWYAYSEDRRWLKKSNTPSEPRDFTTGNLDILLKCMEPYICFDYNNPLRKILTKKILNLLKEVSQYHMENSFAEIITV